MADLRRGVQLTGLESGDYRSICENLYDGIHITDGTGTILFINEAYTRTTGIRPEELIGRKVADIEAKFSCKDCCGEGAIIKKGKKVYHKALLQE